ncbi:hypothetical protein ACHHYP_09711 [Achlya hypogyna]|uniref:Uncharacterized protein n=1 Tax=Achlya hypogyna TaxID=1202772 RepID=A0A1V9YMJ9_ACHHY|nr:hypothetical protein ACHHYP_09711 [Achlya hypogyna]
MTAQWSGALRAGMAVGLLLTLVFNGLHSASGDMREAGFANPNLLTPDKMFFALLLPIYLLLGAFVIRECIAPTETIANIHTLYVLFILSCPCNIAFMALFVSGHVHWAFLANFTMWLLLFAAYLLVEDAVEPIVVTTLLFSTNYGHVFATRNRTDFWLVRMPFTLYWAWNCATATVALNVSLEALGIHVMAIYVFWCGLWVLANAIILIGTGDVPFIFIAVYTLVAIAVESARATDRLVPQNPNYTEHYAITVMASVGAFVLTGLFLFLVLHKWWRGGANFPRLTAGTKAAYGSLG